MKRSSSLAMPTLLLGTFVLSSPAMAVTQQCTPQQIDHNKQLVRILAAADESTPEGMKATADLLAENYVQHNAKILDYQGRQGYTRAVDRLVKLHKNPNYPEPFLLIADCQYVVSMLKEVRPDPEQPGKTYESFWFDIWRVADGKLAEHWDPTMKGYDYHFEQVIRSLSSAEVEPRGPGFIAAPPDSGNSH